MASCPVPFLKDHLASKDPNLPRPERNTSACFGTHRDGEERTWRTRCFQSPQRALWIGVVLSNQVIKWQSSCLIPLDSAFRSPRHCPENNTDPNGGGRVLPRLESEREGMAEGMVVRARRDEKRRPRNLSSELPRISTKEFYRSSNI